MSQRHGTRVRENKPRRETIDFVVGTQDDVTQTGIKHSCAECRIDVYTSNIYPLDVPILCEYCASPILIRYPDPLKRLRLSTAQRGVLQELALRRGMTIKQFIRERLQALAKEVRRK